MSARGRVAAAAAAAALASCTALQDATTRLPGPRLYEHGAKIIGHLRAFEARIGFRPTDNFTDPSTETEAYPFCGHVSSLVLPYSYEDPVIEWADLATEAECRAVAGPGRDVYFGQTEAVAEQGSPVTASMLAGTLPRFVYLVLHEDCHDQFELPQGIEEPLCSVIAYSAMEAYAAERGSASPVGRMALRRYARIESERARLVVDYYGRLGELYAQFRAGALTAEALLARRKAVFAEAEKRLAWSRGALNNVGIANDMTYSRHFPFLESVHVALGSDLARTVAFFRRVDAEKPSRGAVMRERKLVDEESLDFIRAYEDAVLATVRRLLEAQGTPGAAGNRGAARPEAER